MPFAAIALGSNLPGAAGSREANLQGAIEALRRFAPGVVHSPWIETEPAGVVEQPPFLNGAAILETQLRPMELLRELQRIEVEFGRDRSHGIAGGPRTLDLDMLLYDGCVLRTPELVLPHPRMHLRRFVLAPLAEIAPGLRHPSLQKSVSELLRGVS